MRNTKHARAPAPGAGLSTEDPEKARGFLRRAGTPRQMRKVTKYGYPAHWFSAVQFMEIAMALGEPLPPALRRRLSPWAVEIQKRHQQVLVEIRKSDKRWSRDEPADVASEKGAAR
jgi:hypothetical protein